MILRRQEGFCVGRGFFVGKPGVKDGGREGVVFHKALKMNGLWIRSGDGGFSGFLAPDLEWGRERVDGA